MQLVDVFKPAAQGYGTEKRILLLHGPVGSSKSTIARLLKKGLEAYSKSETGRLYTYSWRQPRTRPGGDGGEEYQACPMHEEPLLLIPREARLEVLDTINEKLPEGQRIRLYGDVCPFCRKVYGDLMDQYDGDWKKVMDHIKVKRLILSEKDRRGIGTFQPKDEKNQDSTELTGDINYRKIAEFGSDSDPRAFNFDGELNIANRGIVEFIEVLKLDVAFLYDLLGASQEHMIKPKKFAQTYIDEVILGHTNEPEYKKLKEEAPREGMQGISPRYIQDKISNSLVSHNAQQDKAINPFMVMNELEEGLSHHSLITDEELKKEYKELLAVVREEYEDILKAEVQRAISADEDAIKRLAANYIENVRAYTQHERVRNRYTGRDEDPDERLMRSIEEKIDIPDSRKDDFRQEIMNYIGALALDGKKFEYNTNARLLKALELKLFEDQRDTIKLKNLVSSVVDDETQQKIDVVKQRLIKYFGYNETSATDVLNYVASIFARGDSKQDE